jgi:hypothetical protein
VALAAQHERAAVAQGLQHLRGIRWRRDRIELTGQQQRGHVRRQGRVEILRHPTAGPDRALRLHQIDERVAEQRGRHRRVDMQARAASSEHTTDNCMPYAIMSDIEPPSIFDSDIRFS